MEEAIKEAKYSLREGGIPIGSVVVYNSNVIGRGHNRRVQTNNSLLHAEICAIENATEKIMNLEGAELYTTHMPCHLCAGAIIQFGISKVITGESKTFPHAREFMENNEVEVVDLDLSKCREILQNYIIQNKHVWKRTSSKNNPIEKFRHSHLLYPLKQHSTILPYKRLQYINFYQLPPPHKAKKKEKDKLLSQLSLNEKAKKQPFTVFISIPYCILRCNSCQFFKSLLPHDQNRQLNDYLKCIISQIRNYGGTKRFVKRHCGAIYIGGGTASLLSSLQLKNLMNVLNETFEVSRAEITLEGNPRDFTKEYLGYVRKLPINRISIGLQSTNSNLLKVLNSPHNAERGINSIQDAVELGFKTINVDVMYGIPTQTFSDFQETIKNGINLSSHSITVYQYAIFRNSAMWNMIKNGIIKMPPAQKILDEWYLLASKQIEKNGYVEQGVGNFAKPEHKQMYSELTYLQSYESIGIGAGAYSFINGYLFRTSDSVRDFKNDVNGGLFVIGDYQSVKSTKKNLMERYIVHHLFADKLDRNAFQKKFNADLINEFPFIFAKLLRYKLITLKDSQIKLTNIGKAYIYNILYEFFPKLEEIQT